MEWWLIILLILLPTAAVAGRIIEGYRFDKIMREKRRRDSQGKP